MRETRRTAKGDVEQTRRLTAAHVGRPAAARITTSELVERAGSPDFKIIDIRSPDAYNGWEEKGEERGGHVRGATSLPAKWTGYADWIEIVHSKGIHPRHALAVYGYDEDRTEMVVSLLRKAGYPDVRAYHHFLDEYAPKHPLQRLPRHRNLVSPGWLRELMIAGAAPGFSNTRYVICHAHYRNRADYETGHVPGAIDIDTNALESPETWNRRCPAELRGALESLGISHDTTVILYGRFSSPGSQDAFPGSRAGHLGAFRCAFIMLYAGVEDVKVLNGGLQAWLDEGYELTRQEGERSPVSEFGAEVPAHPELAIDLEQAKDFLGAADKNLVSVRSWKEYIGEVSGYNYIEKKGDIPGAVFSSCGSDAYHMENYRNPDQTCREYHEIAAAWRSAGITEAKHNAFYCGTGWRASEAFFNAWLLGWPRISVYDGGWFEWSNTSLPYAIGNPLEARPILMADFTQPEEGHRETILAGLTAASKTIPSIYFYDETGSAFFEKLTHVPVYYPPRKEASILEKIGLEIGAGLRDVMIVEIGSGDCSKICVILDAIPRRYHQTIRYVPFDVSRSAVETSAKKLLARFPEISIRGIVADLNTHLDVIPGGRRRMFCFLGGTIGNLSEKEAKRFMVRLRRQMRRDDMLLLGVDMVKDRNVMERAYNDPEGITARFNLNILEVVNRLAKTDLAQADFEHVAFYNQEFSRIEMHLRARREVRVSSPYLEQAITIKKGETIHTENSRKFTARAIRALAAGAGLKIAGTYTDEQKWFSVVQLTR